MHGLVPPPLLLLLALLHGSCHAQPELEPDESVCRDDPDWAARGTGTPCERIHWSQCATTRNEDHVTAARVCAVTCGTCELLVGLDTGRACVDDDTWLASNGQACRTLAVLASAMPSFDLPEQCARLRDEDRTAAQACPHACGTCGSTEVEELQVVPSPPPAEAETEAAPTTPGRGSPAEDVATELPPDQIITLRTPLGTLLPVATAIWNTSEGATFATMDTNVLGSFFGAAGLETVLHVPSVGVASLMLPGEAFVVTAPGVFRLHGFVFVPHGAVATDAQDLIQLNLLPRNTTELAVNARVASANLLRLSISDTVGRGAHAAGDVTLAGEWREVQSEFQMRPEQLPCRFIMTVRSGPVPLVFGGVR